MKYNDISFSFYMLVSAFKGEMPKKYIWNHLDFGSRLQ